MIHSRLLPGFLQVVPVYDNERTRGENASVPKRQAPLGFSCTNEEWMFAEKRLDTPGVRLARIGRNNGAV